MKFAIIFSLIILIADIYIFQALKVIFRNTPKLLRTLSYLLFWGISAFLIIYIWANHFFGPNLISSKFKQGVVSFIFMFYGAKFLSVALLFAEDAYKSLRLLILKRNKPVTSIAGTEKLMTRSEFIAKASLLVGAVPLSAMGYGILKGAHDYQIRRVSIKLPNLPAAFDGLRIGQISDIHTGSFFNQRAVQGGIDMLLREKTELIFFTGDLVNYQTKEVKEYIHLLQKIKAPRGVYSVLGNHDYGNYRSWPNKAAKIQNLRDMYKAHEIIGWDLLVDEHRILEENGEKIAILGVGNWGTRGKSYKYGQLDKAILGTEETPVKLLLSHDPSHWDAKIRSEHPDIDVTFAGHTHGLQMGIEVGDFQWSPIKYIYEQWAGLYQKENQYIYVNRGYGYSEIFPGRVGMPPEITVFELKKA